MAGITALYSYLTPIKCNFTYIKSMIKCYFTHYVSYLQQEHSLSIFKTTHSFIAPFVHLNSQPLYI